jgi:hypothetical protein
LVTVYDSGTRGLQVYRTTEQEEEHAAKYEFHGHGTYHATMTAAKHNRRSEAAGLQVDPRGGDDSGVGSDLDALAPVGQHRNSLLDPDWIDARYPSSYRRHLDYGAVRDVPLSGWLIAGGIGVGVAGLLYFGGGAAGAGGAAAACLTKADYCLAA